MSSKPELRVYLFASAIAQAESNIALIVHRRRVWKFVGLEFDHGGSFVDVIFKRRHDLIVDGTPFEIVQTVIYTRRWNMFWKK